MVGRAEYRGGADEETRNSFRRLLEGGGQTVHDHRGLMNEVQSRILQYCTSLFADMTFDREVAQAAEHGYILKLVEIQQKRDLAPRDARLNASTIARYRSRVTQQALNFMQVLQALEASRGLRDHIKVEVGIGSDVTDSELYEAMEMFGNLKASAAETLDQDVGVVKGIEVGHGKNGQGQKQVSVGEEAGAEPESLYGSEPDCFVDGTEDEVSGGDEDAM